MDNYEYPSILSDIDISLERGTELVDPFNLLDVKSIKLDPQFNALFEYIDLENLYNETIDFDPDEWQNIFGVILVEEDFKESLLRFAWWMCREIVYGPKNIHKINIIDLLNNQEKELYINIYIYKTDEYQFLFQLKDGAKMVIKFGNNSKLL
jgi:hypothetical protein